MPQVLRRPQAEADPEDIWWHIAQDNPDAADRLLDTIDERCTTLAQFPSRAGNPGPGGLPCRVGHGLGHHYAPDFGRSA